MDETELSYKVDINYTCRIEPGESGYTNFINLDFMRMYWMDLDENGFGSSKKCANNRADCFKFPRK